MDYMIVGGTSGIGLATAKMAIAAGHSVTVAGRDATKCEAARAIGADAVQLDASNTFITGTVLDCDGGWKLRNS